MPQISEAQMMDYIKVLKAEIEQLKAKPKTGPGVTFKVSEKGALQVNGVGRFPVTLYISQWEKIWAVDDELKAFAEANASKLSRKG